MELNQESLNSHQSEKNPPLSLPPELIQEQQDLGRLISKADPRIQEVRAFGSWAAGRQTPTSDKDVLLIIRPEGKGGYFGQIGSAQHNVGLTLEKAGIPVVSNQDQKKEDRAGKVHILTITTDEVGERCQDERGIIFEALTTGRPIWPSSDQEP